VKVEIHGEEKGKYLRYLNKIRNSGKTYEDIYGVEKSMEIKNKQSKSQKGKIKISEEGKNKLREFHTGKKLSKETKNKISKSLIGNKRNLGKKHSEETKNKISNKLKGRDVHNRYEILQFDLDMNFIKEWNSTSEAARELNKSQGNITEVINGKRKTAYGYIWKKKC